MEALTHSLMGLGGFVAYFGISVILLVAFKQVYTWATPYDEFALIKEKNTAAAIGVSGAIIGFCIAVAGAASNSVSAFGLRHLVDCRAHRATLCLPDCPVFYAQDWRSD